MLAGLFDLFFRVAQILILALRDGFFLISSRKVHSIKQQASFPCNPRRIKRATKSSSFRVFIFFNLTL